MKNTLFLVSLISFLVSSSLQSSHQNTQTLANKTLIQIAANKRLFNLCMAQNKPINSILLDVLITKFTIATQRSSFLNSCLEARNNNQQTSKVQTFMNEKLVSAVTHAAGEDYTTYVNQVRTLLKLHANPNVKDIQGNPILTIAVHKGLTEIVGLLLDSKDIDILQTDAQGNDAIKIAELRSLTEILKMLQAKQK